MALLFLFRLAVPHVNYASAGETSDKQDQGPVGVNGKSFGEFLEVLTLSVLAANADGDLHQHALTAAPSARMRECIRDLSHTTSLKFNYTRQDGIVEDIPGGGIQSGYRVS